MCRVFLKLLQTIRQFISVSADMLVAAVSYRCSVG